MLVAELEWAALREFRRRFRARPARFCPEEELQFVITEISWDLAQSADLPALVRMALENEELMLTTPTATQVRGQETPCAADVLRWRLYEHLQTVLARFAEAVLETAETALHRMPRWLGADRGPTRTRTSRSAPDYG